MAMTLPIAIQPSIPWDVATTDTVADVATSALDQALHLYKITLMPIRYPLALTSLILAACSSLSVTNTQYNKASSGLHQVSRLN